MLSTVTSKRFGVGVEAENNLGDKELTINCTFPPELDDKQLLVYLDGDADRETLSHLQGCICCRIKAENLDRFQKRLTARLYRHTCPSTMELGEYHLHLLSAALMLVVAQHLRECPHCARELAQLESFLSDQWQNSQDSLLGRVKVLIARLVSTEEFTSLPTSSALRGEAKGPITFAADGITIVLDVQPAASGRVNILGQVAADDQDNWTGALVKLRKEAQLQISSTVDDLGAFRCEGVIPGEQELEILLKNGSVAIVAHFEIPA